MAQSESKPVDLATRDFSRILLVKPSSLGDVVHALPVLNGLRVRYPDAQIDWLVGSAFAPLLEGHPAISRLIRFDRNRYGRMIVSPRAAIEFLDFLGGLRRERYELVIDLQGLFRSGFITWSTRAPVRIGFQEAREGARYCYTHRIPPAPENTHAVDRNYAVASMLGFADVPIAFPLVVSDSARASAARLLGGRSAGLRGATGGLPASVIPIDHPPHKPESANENAESPRNAVCPPTILIAPGARGETKRWPADRFVEVIDALAEGGVRCVLVGGRDEQTVCDGIARQCRTRPLNLAGQTSLSELVALVDAAAIVLCHDSALAHIAVARDKPVVCITGPTNPHRTGPYRGGTIVREPVDCAPCYFRKLSQCPHQHRCMQDLPAQRVHEAVRRVLSGAAACSVPHAER